MGGVKSFVGYTLARLGMFLAAFGLVWAIGFSWLTWDQLTVLWTALVALTVSAVASYWLLAGMRDRLAQDVDRRARRIADRFEEARRAEDP